MHLKKSLMKNGLKSECLSKYMYCTGTVHVTVLHMILLNLNDKWMESLAL